MMQVAQQGRARTRAAAGASGCSHDAGNTVLPVQGMAQGHAGHQAPFSQLLSRECHPSGCAGARNPIHEDFATWQSHLLHLNSVSSLAIPIPTGQEDAVLNFLYHKAHIRHQEKLHCITEKGENILISVFQEQTGQTQQGKGALTKWSSSTTTSSTQGLVAMSHGLCPPCSVWFVMGQVWFGIAPQQGSLLAHV